MVLYKRDRSNAYGTLDLAGVAHLLQEAGVDSPKARWYQRYVQWAQIVLVTTAGTNRALQFRVGVFQGSPLGPRVYLYQEVQYMEAVGPGHTGIPSVWNTGVELAFDTERYSDDIVVPAATEEALVAMPSQQDAVAPKFRVRHVPSKEEYLHIRWNSRAGATKAIRHTEYGKAQRRDKRRGMCVLGSHVLSEAAGTELRRRVRGAVAEWATTTIHLAAIQDVARVFTEQVLAQVVAWTRGALSSEADVYRLAAPTGRVWRRKIQVHLKLDCTTLWRILWLAFQVRHPQTVMYRAAVQQQLRVMNTTRQALSAWSTARWAFSLAEVCRHVHYLPADFAEHSLRHAFCRYGPVLVPSSRGTRRPTRSRGRT